MVEQCNRDGGTVERLMVEHWNRGTEIMGQQNRDGGTVDHLMVEQLNKHEGTEYLMVEQWNV